MKRIFATNYSQAGIDISALLLRISFGILMMIPHGYAKLSAFDQIAPKFMSFMGLGQSMSLSLAIFAEFFCSIALVLGLFTRLALIPLIVTASVIVFSAHGGELFGKGESGMHYLMVYVVLMILGPGKYSVDAALARRR